MNEPPSVEPSPPEQSVPRISLRNKLLVFAFALVALPGALLGWLAVQSASAALEAEVGGALAREASHTADRLAAVLRAEQQTLDAFARQDLMRDVRVGDVDKRVSMALAALHARRDFGPHYEVVDTGGRIVAASDVSRLAAAVARASAARNDGAVRLVMRSAIADPDDPQRSLGTLSATYDWAELASVARAVERELTEQGVQTHVLVSTRAGEALGGGGALGARLARGAAEAARAELAAADWIALPDARLIVGRGPLAFAGREYRVLVMQRRADALAPVTRLVRQMALILGLALAAALASAALAARRVVRPLSELTEAIRKLARGESGAPLSVPVRSDDELGALAGAFNRMSGELERTQRELVEAEKFAFVGELAAGVAHEIRTSLGVLKSSSQILDRSLPADANAEVRELAQMVREEVARLGGVVDDLLTLKPARVLRLEDGPLAPLLARAVEFASHAARAKRVRVVCAQLESAEPLIAREPDLIYQVAVNLLVNAVQALAEGGTVELAPLPARDGFGGFEVRDDGPGIPDELRERIFQPFVTGRSGGVGLGLTFVKRVVHEHRGRVTVASEPGRGTRVRVELPLAQGAR
jgi:signal transduction histidine kinase